MSSAQAQFEGLLLSFTNENNETRNQAEKLYNQTKNAQPNQVMQALIQIARTSANESLRNMAMVLLRRAVSPGITEDTFWKSLSLETQTLLKQQLLLGVEREAVKKVRTNFCETVTCVAAEIFSEKGQWEGFFEWLLKISQSTEVAHHRQSALTIFATLAVYMKEAFKGDNFKIIAQLFQTGLHESSPVEVRLAALNATCMFINVFHDQQYRRDLQMLIPAMLDTIASSLNRQDEESAQTALKNFTDMSETDPGFFKPVVMVVVSAMLKIAAARQLQDATRQLALEFLISLIENKPSMCRSIDGFPKSMVDILLQWMLELPEQTLEDWNKKTEDQDDVGDVDNSVIAQEGLDRICEPLTGEVIAPIVFAHLPNFLQNEAWEYRFVGLMALSMTAEGCKTVLKPSVDKVVAMILPSFGDPHPRVRWAAANAAGQLATDFGPKLQKAYHATLLPRYNALLDDFANPKVQSHMAAAVINFCEKFDGKILSQYLDPLLSRMLALVKTPNKMVQEQAISAVASIATCAQSYFLPYYPTFIPLLNNILQQATAEEQRVLRGKAMECYALIGIAVGKETFKNDVAALMEILGAINTVELEADDPQRDFIVETWMRISTCLGEDFVPYLRFIVPPLLQTANINAQISISDGSIVTPGEEEEQPGWDVVDVGDKRLKIHTVALEEKAAACNRLLCFASEMKDGFFPYVQDTAQLMVPLMDYSCHDGVRIAAVSIVPHLLHCAKIYGEKTGGALHQSLFSFLFPPLMESIRREEDNEVLVFGIESIHKTLVVMGPNSLAQDQVNIIINDTVLLIQNSISRRKELQGLNPDNDNEDALIAKGELAEEDEVSSEIAEIVGSLVSYHPQLFMNGFGALLPVVGTLIQEKSSTAERQLAICVFDDVVEHGRHLSFPLWNDFMPFMIKYSQDPHPGVRQAACYGLGVCAQHGGELFHPLFRPVLEALLTTIRKPGSRDDEKNAPPTENAISSIGKLIHYQSTCFVGNELQELVNAWISWLPIEYDEMEAKAVHSHFCNLIAANATLMFGPHCANLPKILTVFAMCLADHELVEDPRVLVELLKRISAEIPADVLAEAFRVLPADHRETLQVSMAPN